MVRGQHGRAGWRRIVATRHRGRSGAAGRAGQGGSGVGGETGMVTAELAVGLPGLVVVAVVLAWLLSLGAAQAGLAQAAREGARAAARGEPTTSVRAAVHRLVPDAVVVVRTRGEQVVVTAQLRREPPMALLQPLARDLAASATGWRERP